MDKVFIYDNYSALENNPPCHSWIDWLFHDCNFVVRPKLISFDNADRIKVLGHCEAHGDLTYFIKFDK